MQIKMFAIRLLIIFITSEPTAVEHDIINSIINMESTLEMNQVQKGVYTLTSQPPLQGSRDYHHNENSCL